jgi:hypothetical protein
VLAAETGRKFVVGASFGSSPFAEDLYVVDGRSDHDLDEVRAGARR